MHLSHCARRTAAGVCMLSETGYMLCVGRGGTELGRIQSIQRTMGGRQAGQGYYGLMQEDNEAYAAGADPPAQECGSEVRFC